MATARAMAPAEVLSVVCDLQKPEAADALVAQVIARFGAAHKVRSNVVAAGLIASDMGNAGLQAASVQKAAEQILLKRFGTTDEVADTVLWLCAEGSRSITGQAISLSGGETW